MSSALAHYQQKFLDVARSGGLVLAHGGDGTPGRSTAESSTYTNVRHASARMRGFAQAAMQGREVAGQRVDSASKNLRADARLTAHIAAWAEYLHDGGGDRPRNGGQRHDSANTIDAIASEMRNDALSPMASQGLTSILPDVYEYQHTGLNAWDGNILPIDSTSVDPAAENYTWYESDNVGVAKVGSTYAMKDIPMVAGPVAQANQVMPILPFLVGMETNFMEKRREALGVRNGKPDFHIDLRKREMCDRTIAEAINALWLYGDPLAGIDGLWNNPSVATVNLAGGAWSGKTSAAILADLINMITVIPNSTQGSPNGGLVDLKKIKILLPPSQFYLISGQIMSAAGSESVLSYFLKTFGLRPDQIGIVYDFQATNSQIYNGGPQGLSVDHGLITYMVGDRWDPKFILPQRIEMPAPPRQTGMGETTFFHARAGGMMVADARRIRYVVGM